MKEEYTIIVVYKQQWKVDGYVPSDLPRKHLKEVVSDE